MNSKRRENWAQWWRAKENNANDIMPVPPPLLLALTEAESIDAITTTHNPLSRMNEWMHDLQDAADTAACPVIAFIASL